MTGCPRTGGPTCPTGADAPTCPAGFEGRGGTLDGTRTFLANTFGHQAAEEFAMECVPPAPPRLPPPGLAKRHPAHPCTINYATDLHSLAPPPRPPGRRRRRYCCTMRRSRKLLFASMGMAQPSCTEWSCAGI